LNDTTTKRKIQTVWKLRLGNTIYAAGIDGAVTLIEDVNVPAPLASTPTFTPSPFPSLTPAPISSNTPALPRPSAMPRASLNCATPLAPTATQKWNADAAARIACPAEAARSTHSAAQMFERGEVFYRADEKKIYAGK
jgi:hypothetical protein